MKKEKRNFYLTLFITLLGSALLVGIFFQQKEVELNTKMGLYGITFSKKYAEEIGLDWKKAYINILDELNVKDIRLPVYWDDIERQKGYYDFSDYDFIIKEGEKRGVNFVLNLGWRLPRWPECHAPKWVNKEMINEIQDDILLMLENTVNHFKDSKAISHWQIENEPFLSTFGICPPSDEEFLKKEINLVRLLDNRPIIITASGELSLWHKEARLGDILGISIYRVVWNNFIGYIRYPIPSWFYKLKASLVGVPKENRFIMELQAEPWVPQGKIIYLSEKDANYSFDLNQFKRNLNYAQRTKFIKAYLWGAEWWYYQYNHGDKSYWELAKTIFD